LCGIDEQAATLTLSKRTESDRARFRMTSCWNSQPTSVGKLEITNCDLKFAAWRPALFPYAFTEQGVAMLSTVFKSRHAIAVNIEIMRAFVRMRELPI
jgi:hypothetical protein